MGKIGDRITQLPADRQEQTLSEHAVSITTQLMSDKLQFVV
jgi:hypothetical protein